MKWADWIIVFSLLLIGLSCLTMSATWMGKPESISSYVTNLLKICFWITIPIIIVAFIYMIVKRRKRK